MFRDACSGQKTKLSHSCHSTLENLECKMRNVALTASLWASSPGCIEWFLEKHDSWKILPQSRHLGSICASLEVSFSGDCASRRLQFFSSRSQILKLGSRKVSNLPFYTPCPVAPRGTGLMEGRGEGADLACSPLILREGNCACLPLLLPSYPPPPASSLILVWQVSRSEMLRYFISTQK